MIVICHYYIIYYKRELVDNTWSNPPSLSKGCNQFSISAILEIKVITKLPNSEQSYKGKVKTHNYIKDKISQQPENCENRNDPDLVQAFLKKYIDIFVVTLLDASNQNVF